MSNRATSATILTAMLLLTVPYAVLATDSDGDGSEEKSHQTLHQKKKYNNFIQFNNPDYQVQNDPITKYTHARNFLPVYPLLDGIPQRTIRNTIRKSLNNEQTN